ncbi:MAG: CHASE3 domain-containing protein [Acidobacteriaceae bacterium]
MDTKIYSRLLMQLVLLPLLALVVLAAGLAYSLRRVERSAAWLDHSDRVIAHGNRLVELIVDEETGIRGYLLSHDRSFLEPYMRAEAVLPEEFDATLALVQDNPEQTANLQRLRRSYLQWQAAAHDDLKIPRAAALSDMSARNRAMDDVRAQADRFFQTEATLRSRRSAAGNRVETGARDGLAVALILAGLWIAWVTLRTFSRLRELFRLQLEQTTQQRDAADASARWLNTTIRSIGDGVIACDPTGCVVFLNSVAERVTGWTEEDAKGHPLPRIFHIVNERTRAIVEGPVEKVLRSGGVVGLSNHTVLVRKDSSECPIDDSAAPIEDANGRLLGIVLVFRDCTERRNSHASLMRAEKLAAAGKLAASIAHEVNNPLEGITNLLFLAGGSTDLIEVREWLEQAQSEVKRLSNITRRTLGFYRESTQPVAYRPADVMEEVISFYVPEASSKKVQLQALIRTRLETYGVPGELRQVLSNLISNSLDAIPDGGLIRLVVRTATDILDSGRTGLRITVADTGSGIPVGILQHIFDPFFTTKLDTGTGLGLWVSKELVEKQGGRLRVRSSVSGARTGTIFSIFIPIHTEKEMVPDNALFAMDSTSTIQ